MTSSNLKNIFLIVVSMAALAACSASTTSSSGSTCTAPTVTSVQNLVTGQLPTNTLPVTVNGSLCTGSQYFNMPCVNVQICTPGDHSHCQTINNLLLDTGSYGLRIFSSVISPQIHLTQVTDGSGNNVVDCAGFGDGSSDWGPVKYADVQIGGEPIISNLPIQVIDSTFPGLSSVGCGTSPDTGPCDAYFNGILGIGLDQYDFTSNYYACSGSSCASYTPTTAPTNRTITNPITMIPNNGFGTDNNGSILELPDISSSPLGRGSVSGTLVLGIDTESTRTSGATTTMVSNASTDPAPTPGTGATHAVKMYQADGSLAIRVTYPGVQTACTSGSSNAANCTQDTLVCAGGVNAGSACVANADCSVCVGGINAGNLCTSNVQCAGSTCSISTCTKSAGNNGTDYIFNLGIIDSGSNGLYFHDPNLPCAGGVGFYCPLSSLTLTGSNMGHLETNVTASGFYIVNSGTLFNSGNSVFYDVGADAGPGGEFDWGLPFFFGHDVYVGINGQSSGLGTGPYVGY